MIDRKTYKSLRYNLIMSISIPLLGKKSNSNHVNMLDLPLIYFISETKHIQKGFQCYPSGYR